MSALPPYYGGKSLAAPLVWSRFGRVNTLSEPFSGLAGVARACPYALKYLVLCDLDGNITNALRAIAWAPDEVAAHASWPISELDLHARHEAIHEARESLERRLRDPEYFDPKLAGWWLWGASCWIGPGFGVYRRKQTVKCARGGINTSHRRGAAAGAARSTLLASLQELSRLLQRAIILHGDWRKAVTPNALGFQADGRLPAAVLLDPVYPGFDGMYVSTGEPVHEQAAEWAREHGDNPQLRIALCGYEGDVVMPDTWECVPWKSKGKSANASRERIWFSPHCIEQRQMSLREVI